MGRSGPHSAECCWWCFSQKFKQNSVRNLGMFNVDDVDMRSSQRHLNRGASAGRLGTQAGSNRMLPQPPANRPPSQGGASPGREIADPLVRNASPLTSWLEPVVEMWRCWHHTRLYSHLRAVLACVCPGTACASGDDAHGESIVELVCQSDAACLAVFAEQHIAGAGPAPAACSTGHDPTPARAAAPTSATGAFRSAEPGGGVCTSLFLH